MLNTTMNISSSPDTTPTTPIDNMVLIGVAVAASVLILIIAVVIIVVAVFISRYDYYIRSVH